MNFIKCYKLLFLVVQDFWLLVQSGEVSCYAFLTATSAGVHSTEFVSCSNTSLSLVPSTLQCSQTHQFLEESHVKDQERYSNTATTLEKVKSDLTNYSLYFGSWIQNDCQKSSGNLTPNFALSLAFSEAAVEFVRHFRWNKLAIISDATNPLYVQIAEKFQNNIRPFVSYIHYVQLSDFMDQVDFALREIHNLNFRIIVVSLKPSTLDLLLSRRKNLKLSWPGYAWLVLAVDNHILQRFTCRGRIISFQQSFDCSFNSLKVNFKFSRLAQLSGDAQNLTTSCYQLVRNSTFINIYQWKGNESVWISNYSAVDGLHTVAIQNVPSDMLQASPRLFSLFAFMYSVVIIIVTLIMTLFICFRKEPEVKASSVTLSIIIFIASYLLLLYLVLLNFNLLPGYHSKPQALRDFVCFLQVWLNGLSFPSVLILSVLLVRLARVYRIFYSYTTLRKWQYHNIALIVFVLLITSPCILVCTVWCAVDPYQSSVTTSADDSGPLPIFAQCSSRHEFYWLVLLAYDLFLCFLLIIMSILTRKITYANFKDTKKIIGSVMIGIILGCCTLGYVIIFRIRNKDYRFTHDLLMISHFAFILVCQFFLFLPKLIPPLKRKCFCCKKAQ